MNLKIEQDGRVRRITLADVARRNVLDRTGAEQLLREIEQGVADPGTGAILLDAEGPVFCGGSEAIAEMPDDLFRFGLCVTKPVVAAVQGVAISAGLAIIANAHVVVAAQGSSFGLTEIREGRSHPGLLDSLARAVGLRRAKELALTGRVFSTPEAMAWGLVHSVAPAFELDDRATATATALSNANPDAVRAVLAHGKA